MSYKLITASAHDTGLPAKSVHCGVTSPPYYGLRAYDGDQDVDWQPVSYKVLAGLPAIDVPAMRCGLGAEPTPEAFIGHLMLVMREMWRVLRDDGIFFVNLGDSYAGSGGSGGDYNPGGSKEGQPKVKGQKVGDLKPKDMMMIPSLFALAARADGWYLRSRLPWLKRNGMPDSASDRPSTVVEDIFMLAKSEKYFFDMHAIKQPTIDTEAIKQYNNSRRSGDNRRFADEDMHKMPRGKDGRLLPEKEAGKGRPVNLVQDVSFGLFGFMVEDGEGREVEARSGSEIQGDREGEGSKSQVQQIGNDERQAARMGADGRGKEKDKRISGGIQEVGETQGRPEKVYSNREIQEATGKIPQDGEGAGELGEGNPQAARPYANDNQHLDSGRMERDQDSPRSQVPLLWPSNGEADNGSCDSAIEGWSSCEGEYRPGVSELQRSEGESNSVSTRNFRSSDFFFRTWQGMLTNEAGPMAMVVNTKGYKEAHFATWPLDMVTTMIKAGTSERGVCPACGAPWERITESARISKEQPSVANKAQSDSVFARGGNQANYGRAGNYSAATTGWQPTCDCKAIAEPIPATVLDPFVGSGTSGRAALQLNRSYIGIDICKSYLDDLAPARLGNVQIEMAL